MARANVGSLTIEDLWNETGFVPNTAQYAAILHVDGPLYLPAGPGSGKTRLLLWRTLNLIVFHGVKPEEVYLSTFTEKAALQLKEGLRTLLGQVTNHTGRPYDLSKMYIGTVHSLCQRIITDRRFYANRHRGRAPLLLDELAQYFHIYKSRAWDDLLAVAELGDDATLKINGLFGNTSRSRHKAATSCISLFNRLSEECISVPEIASRISDPVEAGILAMYQRYIQGLASGPAPKTDFSLLQQKAFEVLTAQPEATKVFRHVIVDEYQDTNTIQERIFFRLAAGYRNICVVGDDDQALYRFRGAAVENFVGFPSRCEQYLGVTPRTIPLDINYRSRRDIVSFYTSFMDHCDWRRAGPATGSYRVEGKNIRAHSQDEMPAVVATTPAKPEVVCQEIAECIHALLATGKVTNANQIAFLFPSMKYQGHMTEHVRRMKEALEEVGLKVYAPRAGRFLEVEESTDLFGVYLHIFGKPHRGEIPGYDYRAYHEWLEEAYNRGKQLLRTIYELRKQYGFSKFIIVVPSIAIFEGVLKTFEITRDHFGALYNNEPMGLTRYDGSQLSRLRGFASSTLAEVMVMTLDAFNKATNNIYKASDKLPGERRPFEYIQETRPILILDEPQNMESDRAKEALRTLHPLFALRYSATHRTSPNLIYRLTPFDAYRLGLVKKIQVYGVTERDNLNQGLLALQEISTQGGITASVRALVNDHGTAHEQRIVLRQGDDLYAKTGRDEYRQGYRVAEIHAGNFTVAFENGVTLTRTDTVGATSKAGIFRQQIEATIEQHMRLQEELAEGGIKVLSLFFVDRVANYIEEDGIIRRLFDEAFEKVKARYPRFQHLRAEDVRRAYFAQRKLPSGEEQAFDVTDSAKDRDAAREAFQLIMRLKERLLSFEEPVSFIFAHSALKEGWDNPNVFQICTLNEAVSEVRKRQEIGRGLRLCVNQLGERVMDDDVNVLTVVANENYREYAVALQSEYVADGEAAPPPPSDARKKWAVRNDDIFLRNQEFDSFWQRLTQRLRYDICVDTPALIDLCVERLDNVTFPQPMLVVEKGEFASVRYTFQLIATYHGSATVSLTREARGKPAVELVKAVKRGDKFARVFEDDRLRHLVVVEVVEAGEDSRVLFDKSDLELDQQTPYVYESLMGQQPREQVRCEPEATYPVFNLLDRAARETGLTRPTINMIFKRLRIEQKQMLLRNPEGFAGVFTSVIRNTLADHIADNLVFSLEEGTTEIDLDELFPARKPFPQRELVDSGARGLYDQVQIDAENEERFVDRLRGDAKVLFYFKFPPAYKVHLPRIIGNYNPDWGIARYDATGRLVLHLVRETKGSADLTKLQFPHEKRKILAAQKHFGALGIDYRHVTGETVDWWMSTSDRPVQPRLVGDD